MNKLTKRYIGIGLLLSSLLLAYFLNLHNLSTGNLALMMFFGAIAWVGVNMLMRTLIANPAGPEFKMWKMLLNAALGFVGFFFVFMIGIKTTHDHVGNELKKYGVTTEAMVIDKDYKTLPAKRGKVNHVYYLTASFKDQDGKQRQVNSEVSASEYARASPGTNIQINYSKRNRRIHKFIFN